MTTEVVLISGGSQGIGRAIVSVMARRGAVTIFLGRNREKGERVAEEVREETQNPAVFFMEVDVSSFQEAEAAVKRVLEEHHKIDVLVNNAGITCDNLLLRMTEEDWDVVLDTNLKSCFNLAKPVIRSMLKERKGSIVNISSVVGITGNPGQLNYAASKAGMIGLTKALAKEVARKNVTVNCIAPGFIETAMTEELNEAQKKAALEQIPLGRFGKPEEIAEAVQFLATSKYITGQVLVVDGGMIM
jgi:3-oxoacyl-[acyl-carrier protein] reductase